MSADTNTLILIQLIILLGATLCISLAFNWFQRSKLNQVVSTKLSESAREDSLSRQQAHDAEQGIDTQQWSTSKEMSELGELSGQQLSLSSQLKEMTTNAPKSSLSSADRVRFLDHIEELENSLLQSRKQINSVNNQLKQANQDLQIERNKAAELKKMADYVPSLKLRETSLLDQAKQMTELIAHHEKEIKRLKQASPNQAPVDSSPQASALSQPLNQARQTPDSMVSQDEIQALKSDLREAKERLKRSEAERTLIENSFVELEASLEDTKKLREEFERLKKEYAMLEQRFIPED